MGSKLLVNFSRTTLVMAAAALLALPTSVAQAATATVGNGISTTDLAAVGMTPTLLASDLAGPGVTVSNVTYQGAPAQAGRIHVQDPAVVSFNDGIILSSGNIADVIGPNKSDGITGDMAGGPDADLTALIANTQTVHPTTYDAAALEFDFVPQASHVYFTYTFGSDEYLEWVNLFNDVFAFYINGQNCATVPTGDPVSIDTINSSVNPQLFRDNSYSGPPSQPINIESDGLSVEMICSAAVNAGQVNHLKLAIADTSDQVLDSVVMLKTNSLSTVKPESCNDGVDNDDDLAVDMNDDSCTSTTTAPAPGASGVGSAGGPPPFTGNEGSPITLDASTLGWSPTSDAVTTSWTVTGINGTPGTCTVDPSGPSPVIGAKMATATAVCPNEGEYVARVDGWDADHKSAFDYDVDFFVHNAPPAITIDTPTAGTSIALGAPVALTASVSDPGGSDSATCEINWGDGTTEAGTLESGTCSGTHSYPTPGDQLVTVTATDNAADSSAAATVIAVNQPATVPAAPAPPTALRGDTAVKVTWTTPDSGGAAVNGYQVQVAPAASEVFTPATGCASLVTVNACTVKSLANGTGYIFRVRAHNGLGWSEFSAPSAAVVPATKPGVPTMLASSSPTPRTIVTSWIAPGSDGGQAIDKYLSRAYLGGTTASKYCYATTAAGCTITGLAAGNYTVKVSAHNAVGWGPAGIGAPLTVAGRAGAPVAVAAASGAPGQVATTWTAPASDGGLVIDKYLSRAYLGGTTASKYCYASTPAGCTIKGLPAGTYTFRVMAHNAAGWGPGALSTPVSVN